MTGRRFTAVVGPALASTLLGQADPIHEAARRGDQLAISRIVSARPEALEARDAKQGNTPLHWAARQGHYDVARILLKKGANPNSRTRDGYTPLRDAAFRGNTRIVQLLLDFGARPDSADNRGATPLHWAGHAGQMEAAALLLQSHASVTREDAFGTTPIEWAREAGQFPCAKMMEKALWQPLKKAMATDDRAALATLLKRYPRTANLEIEHDEDCTYPASRPIYHAKNTAQLEMLLNAGADPLAKIQPDEPGSYIQTSLHTMKAEFLEIVLQTQVDVDSVGELGITPLAQAVWHHDLPRMQVLLKHGANPRKANQNGNTPLHVLADETGRFPGRENLDPRQHVELARTLIEAGANPAQRNTQGLTALELAKKHGHKAVASYLEQIT